MSEEDATQQVADNPPAKPEFVPDKFYDAASGEVNYEAMAKSYAHLEQKLSTQATNVDLSLDTPKSATELAQLDTASLIAEAKSGSISDDTAKELTKRGIPLDLVSAAVAGSQAVEREAQQVVVQAAGGPEEWAHLKATAEANLSPEDRASWQKMMEEAKGNPVFVAAAVNNLKAMVAPHLGSGPTTHSGVTNGGTQAPAGFKTQKEAYEAEAAIRDQAFRMRDPEGWKRAEAAFFKRYQASPSIASLPPG